LNTTAPPIRTYLEPACYLCGTPGVPLYEHLSDRLFEAPGEWSFSQCTSRACGLVWLNPMPTENDVGRAYDGYCTHASLPDTWVYRLRQCMKRGYAGLMWGYADRVGLGERLLAIPVLLMPAIRRHTETAWLMQLRGEKTGRLLDVGCGGGVFLAGMRDLGWHVEGVEVDEKAAAAAREHFGLAVHVGSLESARLATSSFDAITLSHVIEHVHDPVRLLAECRRLLKPNGRLVLITPNVESLGHREFMQSWMSLDPPRHLRLFSLKTLNETTRRSQLEVETLRTTTRWTTDLWIISDRIRREGRSELAGPKPLVSALAGKLFEWREIRLLRRDETAGEELLLIAKKGLETQAIGQPIQRA
jgi:SAM-dependent methyltransferase